MQSGDSDRPKTPSLKGRGIALSLAPRSWNETQPVATLLERFEPLGHLGEGGMGRVLIARDRRLARTVAIKFLSPEFAGNDRLVQRFLTEAQVAAQLEHPNVVPVYGLEHNDDGQPAFVMQLVEGETLEAAIERWALYPSRRALDQSGNNLKQRLSRLIPVCDAVHYAHERNVIHRDLKPSNILIGQYGESLVTDWGLARVTPDPNVETEVRDAVRQLARSSVETKALDVTRVSASPEPGQPSHSFEDTIPQASAPSETPSLGFGRATQHGQALGSIGYMSPEQARDAASVTNAADQFSLGLIALELATLRHARSHAQPLDELTQAAKDGKYRPFVDVWGEALDERLVAILGRALMFSPAERYPTVRAFAADLSRYLRGEALDVLPDSSLRRFVRKMSERPVVTTLLILGSLLLASLGTLRSVWSAELRATRAIREASNLTRLTAKITHRTHLIESRMLVTESNVSSLGVAAVEHVILDALSETTEDTRHRTNTILGSRQQYGPVKTLKPHSSRLPVASAIASNHAADAAESLDRMLQMVPLAEGLFADRTESNRAAFRSDGFFMALDAGAYLELPSDVPLASDYDPRSFAWYMAMKRFRRPTWQAMSLASAPANRELGLLVPLFMNDEVIGTLGALVPYQQLDAQLKLPDEPELICASLLDATGANVVSQRFSTTDKVCTFPNGLSDAMAKKVGYGQIIQNDRRWFFERLDSVGWYYVAEFPSTVTAAEP